MDKYLAEHCHPPKKNNTTKATRNTLIVVSCVCVLFLAAEVVGGVLSNSLALLTDAAHLTSDLASFGISLVSLWLAQKPATKTMSFGYHRAEICGTVLSVLTIWIMTAVLVYFAVQRVITRDFEIDGDMMLLTSSLGILFNIIMGVMLNCNVCARCNLDTSAIAHGHSHGGSHGHSHGGSHGHSHEEGEGHSHEGQGHNHKDEGHNESGSSSNYHDEGSPLKSSKRRPSDYQSLVIEDDEEPRDKRNNNILLRAAFLHVVGDLIQSVGVFVAAIIIKCRPDLGIVDPVCTFLFSVLVMCTTFAILRDSVYVLMEAVPRDVDIAVVKEDLLSITGVKSVHSLHIWALTLEKNAVVVHLAVEHDSNPDKVRSIATGLLRTKHNMFVTHVQTEPYVPEIMENCEECSS